MRSQRSRKKNFIHTHKSACFLFFMVKVTVVKFAEIRKSIDDSGKLEIRKKRVLFSVCFFSQKDIATSIYYLQTEFFKVGFHCTTPLRHCYYAMMNISEEEERQAQQQSYWCQLCRETIFSSSTPLLCPHCHSLLLLLLPEEIESPAINTYPNLFYNSEEAEEEDAEEEDNNSTSRRQYTCFQCNVTISLISSSSSPLLHCPHCHAEFWEELEPLSPSPSTSSNPNLNSTLHIDDLPEEEDEDRYGNSSTLAVTEKKKKSEKACRRVIFHKIRTFFGFAI